MKQKSRKTYLVTAAVLTGLTFSLMPTSAFANYYGYERCMNNGGSWYGCLGELADVMVMDPEHRNELDRLIDEEERADQEKRFILERVKSNEAVCGKSQKQAECYLDAIKGARSELKMQRAITPKQRSVQPAQQRKMKVQKLGQ